jgi:dTDP-L-rhamnose 4-epimerase
MKVLITGGAGFIGSHTTDLLIEKGYDVRVLDNLEPQIHGGKKPDYLNPKTEFINGDINNTDVWQKSLLGVDAVIHLAAMTGIGQSMYRPSYYLNTNVIGTSKFYNLLLDNPKIRNNIRKIIVAGSKTIYGEGAYKCKTHGIVYPNQRTLEQLNKKEWEVCCPLCNENMEPIGIKEDKPPQNLSIYALSKYATEKIAMMFGNAFQIPTTVFRAFSCYGPRQSLNNPYTGVCSVFISRIKNNNPPIIVEDGKQLRDYIYIEDMARANLLALEKGNETEIYNVGTGNPTNVLTVAKTIINALGSNIEPVITQEFRVGDNRHDFADISKIEKGLGFKPKWTFKRGIEELVKWSQNIKATDKFDIAESERKKYFGG